MSAQTLLKELRSLGVELAVEGDQLTVDAPRDTITEDLRASLVKSKPALLKLLSKTEEPQDNGRRFKARRSRYPGYTSLYDPVEGEWHDFPTRDCFPSIVTEVNTRRKGGAA